MRTKEEIAAYRRAYYVANREKWRGYEKKRVEYKLAYRKAHLDAYYRSSENWVKRNPEKRRAHEAVLDAVQAGKLIRPDVCSKCTRKTRIEAHHHDYSKPLDVVWLCRPCHVEEHAR